MSLFREKYEIKFLARQRGRGRGFHTWPTKYLWTTRTKKLHGTSNSPAAVTSGLSDLLNSRRAPRGCNCWGVWYVCHHAWDVFNMSCSLDFWILHIGRWTLDRLSAGRIRINDFFLATTDIYKCSFPQTIRDWNHFRSLLSPLLKVPRMVLLSSLRWWELGTGLPGPGEWLSFWRVTSRQFCSILIFCLPTGSKPWHQFKPRR